MNIHIFIHLFTPKTCYRIYVLIPTMSMHKTAIRQCTNMVRMTLIRVIEQEKNIGLMYRINDMEGLYLQQMAVSKFLLTAGGIRIIVRLSIIYSNLAREHMQSGVQ